MLFDTGGNKDIYMYNRLRKTPVCFVSVTKTDLDITLYERESRQHTVNKFKPSTLIMFITGWCVRLYLLGW